MRSSIAIQGRGLPDPFVRYRRGHVIRAPGEPHEHLTATDSPAGGVVGSVIMITGTHFGSFAIREGLV